MRFGWRDGNRLDLLENGDQYFPSVFAAINSARSEVLIETFILFADRVGQQLQQVLIEAAMRGVRIDVTVDGYGSDELNPTFTRPLTNVGVRIHIYDPRKRLLGQRTNLFRRLHRKIVVVDGEIAYIGGINFSADHLLDFGPTAKQDYALRLEGPVVSDIHRFALKNIAPPEPGRRWWRRRHIRHAQAANAGPCRGEAQVLFVTRDNDRHHCDIEQHYLAAIRSSRERLLIANAYFFPGYRVLRELRAAARRGVQVRLILQGQPDMPIARFAARMFYNYLMRDGVEIHEYIRRPLHAKVALADRHWSTVGSSNLDPLSLSLNLEANVFIHDRAFNRTLDTNLKQLLAADCRPVPLQVLVRGYWWRAPLAFVIYHFLRFFPRWAGILPRHRPKVKVLASELEPNPPGNLPREPR